MTTKRTGEPWMTPPDYGATLGGFSLNLVVTDVARSLTFYTGLLGFTAAYSDEDFAALEGHGLKLQLHADHTWEDMPWHARLSAGEGRGLGTELRILGLDPDRLQGLAPRFGAAVMLPASDFPGHGWREVYLEDPDGYLWVAGRLLESAHHG